MRIILECILNYLKCRIIGLMEMSLYMFRYILTNLTSLLINCLGRYARVLDHLAVQNVAQGATLTYLLHGAESFLRS